MADSPDRAYSQTQGMKLLEAAARECGPVFTLVQLKPIAGRLNLSEKHLRKIISVLASAERIEILKRGTYALKSGFFAGEIQPFAIAASLAQPSAISHWSALAHHGFTTQLPAMVQVSTPRKVITPEMRAGRSYRPRGRTVWKALDIEIEFIHVQERHFFGHQEIWVNRWQQVSITDPERTALDLIARSNIFGGMRAAVEIFEEILPRITPGKLVDYALQYNVGALIKRLGWFLEQLNVSDIELAALQNYPVSTYYRLDPHSEPTRRHHARWHIIDNLRSA